MSLGTPRLSLATLCLTLRHLAHGLTIYGRLTDARAMSGARSYTLTVWVAGLVATSPCMPRAQAAPTDPFSAVAALVGTWVGTVTGEPGTGTVRRTYARALNTRFIRVENESTYPPQEKNAKGEVHQDEGFISFDRARKTLVLRQFHVEGFVSHFAQQPASAADRIVFESEAIENIPPGWRARETYVITGPNTFEETFELAEPGKGFAAYSRSRFTRVP